MSPPTPTRSPTKIFGFLEIGLEAKWISWAFLIGLITGGAAIAFYSLLEIAIHYVQGVAAGMPPSLPAGEQPLSFLPHNEPQPRRWVYFLLPSTFGLLSAWLVYRFAPTAKGIGTDAVIKAFHHERGRVPLRVPIVKGISSILVLAGGGSSGREGPIAQIGAGIASWIGGKLKLDDRQRRVFLLAGMAGGIGAIFRAPLGGAVTAIEIPFHEDLETDALIPCIVSSVTAFALFSFVFGYNPIFGLPVDYRFQDPREVPFFVILALLCIPIGILYVRVFKYTVRRVEGWSFPSYLKPAVGGLGLGVLGLAFPQVYGGGYGVVQEAILGNLGLGLMVALVFAKIAATCFTMGFGASGGVFGPSMFIGGMLGGAVGYIFGAAFPEVTSGVGAYVLVGMAAFFAGAANAPMGALLMVVEITGSYGLLAPIMIVCVIAMIFTRKYSIYFNQLKDRFHSPAHFSDLTVDVLREVKVSEIFKPTPAEDITLIPHTLHFRELRKLISRTKESFFPVINDSGNLVGIFALEKLRTVMFEESLMDLVVVAEVMGPPARIGLEEDLHTILSRFLATGYAQLPVVSPDNPDEVLGTLSHADVISIYNDEIARRQTD